MTEYRLKAVYFPGKDTRLGYRKAMVYEDEIGYFIDLGASRTPPEVNPEPKPETAAVTITAKPPKLPSAIEGDKGSGRPGSKLWHKTNINAIEKRKGIINYMQDLLGGDAFPHVFSEITEDTRKRALQCIEDMKQ